MGEPLTETEQAMLTLEDTYYKHAGVKERHIRERFDLAPTIFWRRVDALLDRPEALEWNAQLVRRLIRIREQRRRQRSARARGVDLN